MPSIDIMFLPKIDPPNRSYGPKFFLISLYCETSSMLILGVRGSNPGQKNSEKAKFSKNVKPSIFSSSVCYAEHRYHVFVEN